MPILSVYNSVPHSLCQRCREMSQLLLGPYPCVLSTVLHCKWSNNTIKSEVSWWHSSNSVNYLGQIKLYHYPTFENISTILSRDEPSVFKNDIPDWGQCQRLISSLIHQNKRWYCALGQKSNAKIAEQTTLDHSHFSSLDKASFHLRSTKPHMHSVSIPVSLL